MSSFFAKFLNQVCTYWSRAEYDQYGSRGPGTPVQLKCRWEDRDDIERTLAGEEFKTRAVVWVDRDLDEGGYLFLGASTVANPITLQGAFEIRMFRKIPSVRGSETERLAKLA